MFNGHNVFPSEREYMLFGEQVLPDNHIEVAKNDPNENPCISCGACCAFFKVPVGTSELIGNENGWVPLRWVDNPNTLKRTFMRGSLQNSRRCEALDGDVGVSVRCSIYAVRPLVCREFAYYGQDDGMNMWCTVARKKFGLPPLGYLPRKDFWILAWKILRKVGLYLFGGVFTMMLFFVGLGWLASRFM